MPLIQQLITKFNQLKTIHTNNLYYGYIGTSEQKNSSNNSVVTYNYTPDISKGFVIMQRLNTHERNNYLKCKYNTFWDSDNNQTLQYLAIKNSDIDFYRIPSMNNMVIPCIDNFTQANLLGNCTATTDTCLLGFDFDIKDRSLPLKQIREYEQKLNGNRQQTYYHSEIRKHDYELCENQI